MRSRSNRNKKKKEKKMKRKENEKRKEEDESRKENKTRKKDKRKERKKRKRKKKEKEAAPTPAQAQKAFPDQPSANLPRHRHVGLPGLGEDPAEGCQEEKVQKGRRHDTDTLRKKRRGKKHLSRYFSNSP